MRAATSSAKRPGVRFVAASSVRDQRHGQRGKKIYSLHEAQTECIGKGKSHRPYEFGVKVSIATTLEHSKGGQFAVHAMTLPGNPYDGHTLASVLPAIEKQTGATLQRAVMDKGCRGGNASPEHAFKI